MPNAKFPQPFALNHFINPSWVSGRNNQRRVVMVANLSGENHLYAKFQQPKHFYGSESHHMFYLLHRSETKLHYHWSRSDLSGTAVNYIFYFIFGQHYSQIQFCLVSRGFSIHLSNSFAYLIAKLTFLMPDSGVIVWVSDISSWQLPDYPNVYLKTKHIYFFTSTCTFVFNKIQCDPFL